MIQVHFDTSSLLLTDQILIMHLKILREPWIYVTES